jgi:hypothetical protein
MPVRTPRMPVKGCVRIDTSDLPTFSSGAGRLVTNHAEFGG